MRCVIGLDGGGTKTESVLLDEQQRVLARSRSGASNPFRCGVAPAVAALHEAIEDALRQAQANPRELLAIVAALAGAGRPDLAEAVRAELLRAYPDSKIQVITDIEAALAAMEPGPALVLVAGTGSAAIGRDAAGRVLRGGGHGAFTGDEGSAQDIGRKAVAAVLREREAGHADAALERGILRELAFTSWRDLQSIASDAVDDTYPRVCRAVLQSADAGDPLAQSLLREAAGHLARLAADLAARLAIAGAPFRLGKTGGLCGRADFFDQLLDELLRQAVPRAAIVPLPRTAGEAAALLALQLAAERQTSADHR
jgi:glucosamine kinase